jgi:UPF0716 protein FxsA
VAILVVLFIVVPIAELFVIIKMGELIGVMPTILFLLASAMIGALLLRHQGRGAWRRFNEALSEGRFPGKEVADGALIVVGGTLLVTPGFITDAVGVLLLLPPTRALARRLLKRVALSRFTVVNVGFGGGPFGRGRGSGPYGGPGGGPFGPGGGPGPGGATRPYDIDGTAEESSPNGNGHQLPRVEEE